MSPNLWEGNILILVRVVSFVGVGVGVGVTPFLSAQYLVNQWLDSYQIFMDIHLRHSKKKQQQKNKQKKNWLDFGDPDLIFKVIAVEKLKIRGWGTSLFSENF